MYSSEYTFSFQAENYLFFTVERKKSAEILRFQRILFGFSVFFFLTFRLFDKVE